MVNKKIFGTTTSIILWFISTAVASTVAGCLLFLFYETPFSQSKNNEINVLKKEVQEYKKTLCKQPSVVIVQTSNKEKVDMENFVERVENFYEKRLNTLLAVFTAIISIVGIALPIVSMFLQDNHYKDNMSAIIDMKERANNNEIAIKNLLNKTRMYLPIALSAGKKAQRAQDNAEAAIEKLTENTIKYEEQFAQMSSDWHAQNAANYNGLARTFMELFKTDRQDIHIKNAIIYLFIAINFNIKANKAEGIYSNIDFLDTIFSHNSDAIKKYQKPLSAFPVATVDDIRSIIDCEFNSVYIEKYENILSLVSGSKTC